MEVFHITLRFPKEEMYSLSSQIRNSSRSIPANIAEGWAKRIYENIFKRHLVDAIGSTCETIVWLDFALDCKYIDNNNHLKLSENYKEVGKMLNGLLENWQTY
ncbi:MAG: four helix bundle protein [Nitrospirae bacterium]|nr:four helix bundle protein [Nitrospirota bacterium]